MGKGSSRAHIRREFVIRILKELAIALAIGAAGLYVVVEWPIEIATFIYRDI